MFERNQNPKVAMGTGVPKCGECHKPLGKEDVGRSVCVRCRNKDDVFFLKRREVWASPMVPFILIISAFYYFFFGIYWLGRWCYYSSIRPFSYSKNLCEKGFHKYRFIEKSFSKSYYRCNICGEQKSIDS